MIVHYIMITQFTPEKITVEKTVKKIQLFAVMILAALMLALFTTTLVRASSDEYTRLQVDTSGNVGKSAALTLLNKKKPVIAYYDATNKVIKLALCQNASCTDVTTQTIDGGTEVLDPKGAVDVAIIDGNPAAVYAEMTNAGGRNIVLARCISANCEDDEEGNAHLLVYQPATYTGDTTDVATAVYKESLIIGYVYSDTVFSVIQCEAGVEGCTEQGSGTFILDDATKPTQLNMAVDADGNVVMTYVVTNGSVTELRLVKCDDSACSDGMDFVGDDLSSTIIATVSGTGKIVSSALALNSSNGKPVVAYYDKTAKKIVLLLCDNGNCASGKSATLYSGSLKVSALDLALNGNNVPVVSYALAKETDTSKNTLQLGICADKSCSSVKTKQVDTEGNVGLHNALAINKDGQHIIVYYDAKNKDLKIAKRN